MPNRILKESICYSESLRQLDDPASEVLFYRLMVQCDDFGRGDGRPEVVSARCYQLGEHGASPAVIAARLGRLAAVDLVRFYEVDGRRYLYLPRWDKHQSRRAKTSKYPAPPARECNGKQILPPETASKQVLADASRREQMLAHVPVFVFEESRNRGIDSTLSPAAPSAVEPADPMPSAAAIPSTPHQAIVDLYHQHCPSLPRVRELTEARKRTLRLRWKRYPDLGTWRQLFRQAEAAAQTAAIEAYVMAQVFVRRQLLAPATARFAPMREATVTNLGGGRWYIAAYVDAQNAFGAMIRTPFRATLRREGDIWHAESVKLIPR